MLKPHFFFVEKKHQLYPDLTIYDGKLDNNHISVGMLGIGKVNAAYATTQYIIATKPEVIILFGSAGGLHSLTCGVLHSVMNDTLAWTGRSAPLSKELNRTVVSRSP